MSREPMNCGNRRTDASAKITLIHRDHLGNSPLRHTIYRAIVTATRHRHDIDPAFDDTRDHLAIDAWSVSPHDRHRRNTRRTCSKEIGGVGTTPRYLDATCRMGQPGYERTLP